MRFRLVAPLLAASLLGGTVVAAPGCGCGLTQENLSTLWKDLARLKAALPPDLIAEYDALYASIEAKNYLAAVAQIVNLIGKIDGTVALDAANDVWDDVIRLLTGDEKEQAKDAILDGEMRFALKRVQLRAPRVR